MAFAQEQARDPAAEFAQARAERAAGQYDAAIPRLRAILRKAPDAQAVREELGYVLILDEQYAAAQYHFEILAETTPDPQRRTIYRAVLARIRAERPFGIGLVFQIVPSSNLNNGSGQSTFQTSFGELSIADGSRAQSGWRRNFGLTGFARTNLGPNDQLRLDLSAVHTSYSSASVEDSREFLGRASWTHGWDSGRISLSLGHSVERSASERLTSAIYGADGIFATGQRTQVLWGLQLTEKSYRSDPGASGPERIGYLRHRWLLPRGKSVWLGIIMEDSNPFRAHQQYRGRILQAGGRQVLRGGTVIDTTLSVGARDFEGVFPALTFAREDDFRELSISVQDSRLSWKGVSPRFTCTLRSNSSNVALFDSTTQECGIELSRRF